MDSSWHAPWMVVERSSQCPRPQWNHQQSLKSLQILPWDWDLDVQMSADTLTMIGDRYNMTRHKYVSKDGLVEREYLLDVNPWIWQRVRGDGMNVIDARWVDVRNGLYIDITGIAETQPDSMPNILNCKNYHRYHVSTRNTR